jgi:hypothetical protein
LANGAKPPKAVLRNVAPHQFFLPDNRSGACRFDTTTTVVARSAATGRAVAQGVVKGGRGMMAFAYGQSTAKRAAEQTICLPSGLVLWLPVSPWNEAASTKLPPPLHVLFRRTISLPGSGDRLTEFPAENRKL